MSFFSATTSSASVNQEDSIVIRDSEMFNSNRSEAGEKKDNNNDGDDQHITPRIDSNNNKEALSAVTISKGAQTAPVNIKNNNTNQTSKHRTANSRLHYILHKDSSQSLNNNSSEPSINTSMHRHSQHHHQQHNPIALSPQLYSPIGSGSSTPKGGQSPSTGPSSPITNSTTASSSVSVKETHHINIDYDPVSGRKTLNTYEIIRELGRGQHGKVKLGRDIESGEYVAIKVVDRMGRPRLGRLNPRSTQEDKIKREIAIMKKLTHRNIVRLREVLDDSTSKKIYMVLEYMEKGEICWQTETGEPAMSRFQVKSTARDVLLGLEYLHYQQIIHRDIKPANLLLSADQIVKISDFGVSYASDCGNHDELELAKTAGTPAFFAPELCVTSTDSPRPPITYKIDIWAFGVTLFCLLYGCVPFIADSEFELFKVIAHQPLIFPDEVPRGQQKEGSTPAETLKQMSMFYYPRESLDEQQQKKDDDETSSGAQKQKAPLEPLTPREVDADLELAKDLMRKLMEKDPEKRISIEEIKRHPWICDGLESHNLETFLTNASDVDERIEVTGEEVRAAVQGITGKIKRGLTKFGSTALQFAGLRRRKSSSTSSSTSSTYLGSSVGAGSSRSNSREPPPQPIPNSSSTRLASNPSSEFSSPVPTVTRPSVPSGINRPLSGGPSTMDSNTSTMYDRRRSSATSSLSSSVGGGGTYSGSVSASSSYTGPAPPLPPASDDTISSSSARKTMSSSTSNFNLNALLQGTVDPSPSSSPQQQQSTGKKSTTDTEILYPASGGQSFRIPQQPLQVNPGSPQPAPQPKTFQQRQQPSLVPTIYSQSSSSSSEEDAEDDEDGDNDNGELTLVLGPPSRSVSRGPAETAPSSPSGRDELTPRKRTIPSSPLRGVQSGEGLRIFQDDPRRSSSTNPDNNNTTNDNNDNTQDNNNNNDKFNRKHRSNSVTVGILQRPPPQFDM